MSDRNFGLRRAAEPAESSLPVFIGQILLGLIVAVGLFMAFAPEIFRWMAQ